MEGRQALSSRVMQYGDIVYFSLESEGEERIWTFSNAKLPHHSFTPRSDINNIAIGLFRVDPVSAIGSDEDAAAKLGKALKPEGTFRLYHLHSGAFVSFTEQELALEVNLNTDMGVPLGLCVYTQRIGIEDGVCDLDSVAILARPGENPFSLAGDFWFKGASSDRFVIHRFDSFTEETSNDICLGHVCKLRADNGMFLSVKPNSASGFQLVLSEEEMVEDYKQGGEFCFPEYQGELRVDLCSNGDDGNAYWVLENEDRFAGGKMQVGAKFYVLHVASSRYLSPNLTLTTRDSVQPFTFCSPDDVPGTSVGYGEFNCLTSEHGAIVSLDFTPSVSAIKTQIFQPVLSDMNPNTELRLGLSMQSTQAQKRSLTFACQQVESLNANVVVELAMYLTRLSEMRLGLQHLKKQPVPANVLYGISNRIRLGKLSVTGPEHTFLANIASDFQIVNELLRIWILMKDMFSDYENLFTDVTFFVELTNPMQNIQFYERVSRNLFANRTLLLALDRVNAIKLSDILQWTLKAQPPKNEERLFWAHKYLLLIPSLGTYNDATDVQFFCHYLLDRVESTLEIKDTSFVRTNQGNHFILRFDQEDGNYFGSTYHSRAPFAEVISGYCGFTATALELFADLCSRTRFKEEIVRDTGLDLATARALYTQASSVVRVQMSLLYFVSEAHVPGSCGLAPLSEITNNRLLRSALNSGTPSLADWFYFPDASSPLADMIKDEVYFWLSTVHVPITCDDPTTWYYNTVTHFRFIGKLIEHCPVSDMFVASMVSAAVALTWTALNQDIEGFSDRFPKLRDSKYRVETEKQRVVEELLDLLIVYRRWKTVKVLRKCSQLRTPMTKEIIQGFLQELNFHTIFSTYCQKNGIPEAEAGGLSGNSPLPALAQAFSKLLSDEKKSIKAILQFFVMKTQYSVRGSPTMLLDLIDSESDQSDFLLRYFSEITSEEPFAEFLPLIHNIRSCGVSHFELSTRSGESVYSLPEYIICLEELADFMFPLESDSNNLAQYQEFLSKANFCAELQRAWGYCLQIPASSAEDTLFVKLRTLTIQLSRLYVSKNEANKKQLLRILPADAFYIDYPQFIRLLTKTHLLEPGSEVASSLTQVVFSMALQSDKKRFHLALKELLTNKKLLSKTLFTVAEYYKKAEKASLSNCEWEMLILASLYAPAAERATWLGDLASAWYGKDSSNIRREGAAITIFASKSENGILKSGMESSINHLTQINSRTLELIESNFTALRDIPQTRRDRNFEVMDSDIRYLFELFFEEKSGVIYHIPEWQDVEELPQLVAEFAKLYLKIAERETLNQFSAALYPLLVQYSNSNSSIDEEVRALLNAVQEKPVVYEPFRANIPTVPSLTQVFSTPKLEKGPRPMIVERIAAAASFSIKDFEEMKRLFLLKQAEEDYLQACLAIANLPIINADAFARKEDTLMPLVHELFELAIVHKKEYIQELALRILGVFVGKILEIRKHIILALSSRRLYLRFFGVFESLIEKRRKLKAEVNREESWYRFVLAAQLEDVDRCLVTYMSLLQKCCDGCYTKFQTFMRDQGEGDRSSVNLVRMTAELLMESLSKGIENTELIVTCAKALLEMVSGPRLDNQVVVCKTVGLLGEITKQVQLSIEENFGTGLEMLESFVDLVSALLEGQEKNTEEVEKMMGSMNFSAFAQVAVKLSALISDADLYAMDLGLPTSLLSEQRFKLALKCTVICFSSMKEENLHIFEGHRLLKYIASVDIQQVNSDSQELCIRTVTFPVPFIAQFLTSQTAAKVLLDLDRESRHIKLEDFTRRVDECEVEMKHQQRLARSAVLKFFTQFWKYYFFGGFGVALVINLILLDIVKVREDTRFFIPAGWLWTIRIIGLFQASLITIATASYYREFSYVLWHPMKTREESTEVEELPYMKSPGAMSTNFVQLSKSETEQLDVDEAMKAGLRLLYVLVAWMSILYQFLYPLLLFQLINLNDSVVNILKAVTHRGGQLLLTLFFALMVMFVYTFIAYFFLYEYYTVEGGMYCDSLRECFFSTVNMGMRSGGGLGDALGPPTDESDFLFRLIFDLLFYITITTVLMAIVFGLIVDTFSELRDEKNQRETDMNNICMICGHNRSVIELNGEGWKKHALKVHNPFSYMYFLLYVKDKEILECSGTEKLVKECREAKDISFYPTSSKAIGLNEEVEE